MSVRLMMVEDDARIRASLRLALEDEGYTVVEVADGEAALEQFTATDPDLVLVDLMLPGITGFDVTRGLRAMSDVPIVIVTARADTHDVVAGLEAGADDYLTKPVEPKELGARVRALLRRVGAPGSSPPMLSFGELEILPASGIVRRGGDDVALTKTEFRLLCELALNAGIVLSREQLLENVWGYDYVGDGRLVDAHIRRLRTKIEPDPSAPTLIVTVRGLGYRMEPAR